jgi:tetratricopeptide (TPR) repeat protein
MKRILFVGFLLISLMVCWISPAWAGGLDDLKAAHGIYLKASSGKSGNYDEAIALFTKAIESGELSRDDLKGAYYYRGRAWYGKGDLDKAIADFTKAIAINPEDFNAYYNRGLALANKGAFDKAIADFTKAIKINPNFAYTYGHRGKVWYDKKDYDKAIADYTKAIKLDPNDFDAYDNRGKAWDKKGDHDKAKVDYAMAKELMAAADFEQELMDDIFNYDKAKAINPKALAFYNSGLAWYDKKDYDKAITDYTKAIEIDSKYADAYYYRGAAWHDKGNLDKAITDYTKAIAINPKDTDAYYYRGRAWYGKGDLDKAIADYTKTIELKPKYTDAYYYRGLAWELKGNHDKAIADFTTAIQLNPKYASAYNGLAWLMATCPEGKYRDDKRAVELAEKALKLEDAPNTLDTLAAAYAEAGRFQEAIKTQERAITKLKQEGELRDLPELEKHLSSYKAGKPWREK